MAGYSSSLPSSSAGEEWLSCSECDRLVCTIAKFCQFENKLHLYHYGVNPLAKRSRNEHQTLSAYSQPAIFLRNRLEKGSCRITESRLKNVCFTLF